MAAGRLALALALALAWPHAARADGATLLYRDANKWVAAADRQPLTRLLGEAESGVTYFEAVLPRGARPLSISRLEVLRDLLAREAGRPVVIEETDGDTPANTLRVRAAAPAPARP